MEQMTLSGYMHTRYYDRKGRTGEAPDWVKEERCGNCKHWQLLPEHEQPPCGWGVKGLCGGHRSQNRHATSQTSYCMEFEAI